MNLAQLLRADSEKGAGADETSIALGGFQRGRVNSAPGSLQFLPRSGNRVGHVSVRKRTRLLSRDPGCWAAHSLARLQHRMSILRTTYQDTIISSINFTSLRK